MGSYVFPRQHIHRELNVCTFRYQIATGGADDTVRIWDIRALRPVSTIPAHRSNVSDIRFFHSSAAVASCDPLSSSPMNREAETQDLDRVAERYKSGLFMVTSGYDGLVKIWSADDWQLVRSLTADDGKVMSVDVAGGIMNNEGVEVGLLASGSFSRNFQLFAVDGYSG